MQQTRIMAVFASFLGAAALASFAAMAISAGVPLWPQKAREPMSPEQIREKLARDSLERMKSSPDEWRSEKLTCEFDFEKRPADRDPHLYQVCLYVCDRFLDEKPSSDYKFYLNCSDLMRWKE